MKTHTFTAAELMAAHLQPVTVRELVESGECYGACLTGSNTEACNCPCGGDYHGAALNLEVQGFYARGVSHGDYVRTWDRTFYGEVIGLRVVGSTETALVRWVSEDGSGESYFPTDRLVVERRT